VVHSPDSPIRVIIVDDHKFLLELLAAALEQKPGLKVVASCSCAREAIEAARRQPSDVILIDIVMPGIDGLECIRAIRRDQPRQRFLIMSGNTQPLTVSRALQLGIKGYIEKNASIGEILQALTEIAAGRIYFGGTVEPKVRRLSSSPFPLDAADRLTERERVVLAGIASGGTSKKIASQLGLSEFTVKSHRRRIKSKTGLQTNAELVLHAAKLGLCPQVSP
jgi:DNA-binding NarL/FixJ family response regulator